MELISSFIQRPKLRENTEFGRVSDIYTAKKLDEILMRFYNSVADY